MSTPKVMKLIDSWTGRMQCKVCGYEHVANVRPGPGGQHMRLPGPPFARRMQPVPGASTNADSRFAREPPRRNTHPTRGGRLDPVVE